MLVSSAWLAEHLDDPRVVVLDMRWREDGTAPRLYREGHVAGAVFLDWTSDIVEPPAPVGFMLASPERFAAAMRRCGVGTQSHVVAYADQRGSGPHRLWWALQVFGHEQASVLDGGLEAWLAAGGALSQEVPRPQPGGFVTRPGRPLLATAADVASGAAVVLDSRPPEQHAGTAVWFETGAVDADADGIARTPRGPLRAGHIPGSLNVPWFELYRPDGTMRPPEELRALLRARGVEPGRPVITYCGVGISASALLVAVLRAGFDDVRLYDGSWDEWGRDASRPVERG
jgi:thiosulfate/3-mercaptopyruvate sulfurtransferase